MYKLKDQKADAARTLAFLAKGLDPKTQTRLTVDAVLREPGIVRALFSGAEALRVGSRNSSRRRGVSKTRAGQLWSSQEDLSLERAFKYSTDINHLARSHQRSRGAIYARLAHLSLIDPGFEKR